MSFSNEVKNELARIESQKKCCEKAELLGLLRMSGAVILQGRNMGINFSTENAALARRMLQMLKTNYNVQTEVLVTRSRRLKKNNRYQVRVIPSKEAGKALHELQLLPYSDAAERHKLLAKSCCRRAFLRGVFMAGGSVSKPSSDYHLELVTENEELAAEADLLAAVDAEVHYFIPHAQAVEVGGPGGGAGQAVRAVACRFGGVEGDDAFEAFVLEVDHLSLAGSFQCAAHTEGIAPATGGERQYCGQQCARTERECAVAFFSGCRNPVIREYEMPETKVTESFGRIYGEGKYDSPTNDWYQYC